MVESVEMGSQKMGCDPRLGWILSSDSKMFSVPPCVGPASLNSAGICAIGMAIMATGIPPSAGGTGKFVVLLNYVFDMSVNYVVALPPSSA